MKYCPKGFTLIELLIVLAIMSVVLAISLPNFISWRGNIIYRDSAREISQHLRQARSLAVSSNRMHRVEIDATGNRYRMVQLNPLVNYDWQFLPAAISLRHDDTTNTCGDSGTMNIDFNTNGTSLSGAAFICIREALAPNTMRFQVEMSSGTSGHVVVSN